MASRLEDVIQRGIRSAQPAATTVAPGTLYFVTDEGVIERSTGAAWQSYSGTGGSSGGISPANYPIPIDGIDGIDGLSAQGAQGPQGTAGAPGVSGAMTLIHSGSGNTTASGAETVDSVATGALTAVDQLVVTTLLWTAVAPTNTPMIISVTDSNVRLVYLRNGTISGDSGGRSISYFGSSPFADTVCIGETLAVSYGSSFNNASIASWVAGFTIGLRHLGVSASGTLYWKWSVFKLLGQ